MMKSRILMGAMFGILFTAVAFGVPMTQIQHEPSEFGSGRCGLRQLVKTLSGMLMKLLNL